MFLKNEVFSNCLKYSVRLPFAYKIRLSSICIKILGFLPAGLKVNFVVYRLVLAQAILLLFWAGSQVLDTTKLQLTQPSIVWAWAELGNTVFPRGRRLPCL